MQTWHSSKLFSHITDRIQPNLTELQQDIQLVAFATLPQTVREQLINDPKGYFQQYAEDIVTHLSEIIYFTRTRLAWFWTFCTANTTR